MIAEVRSHWDIFRYKQRKVKGATDSRVMHRSLKSYLFWFIVWDLEKAKLRRQEYGSRAWDVAGEMRSETIVHETVLVGTCIVHLSKSVTLRRASEAHCKLRTCTSEQFHRSMVVKESWGILVSEDGLCKNHVSSRFPKRSLKTKAQQFRKWLLGCHQTRLTI